MSKKSKTTNTVAWSAPPATQATTNLQTMVDTPVDYATPIRNSYARAEQNLDESYQNPLGGYTTADVRDKSLRSQKQSLHQNMGLDLSNAAQQSSGDRFNRQATVAGLTRPNMYNSGGTSTVSDPWGTAMQIGGMGASLGSAAMGKQRS